VRALLTPAIVAWLLLLLVVVMILFVRVRSIFLPDLRLRYRRTLWLIVLLALIYLAAALAVVWRSSR
jgi:hypothetical protein